MTRTVRRLVLLLGAAVLLGILGVATFSRFGGDDGGATSAATAPTIVSEPAPGEPVGTDAAPSTSGGSVAVVVTYSSWDDSAERIEVGGFISGVVESSGTCRLTVTREDKTAIAEAAAEPDASTMACGALTVDGSELSPGKWSAVLSYQSATSTGAAEAVTVEVPR
jgi:hypothetical protein